MRLLDAGDDTVVVDVARSVRLSATADIPGALWGIRTRPGRAGLRVWPSTPPWLRPRSGGGWRAWRSRSCAALPRADVTALDGGTELWRAHGRPVVQDRTSPPDEEAAIDCYLRPYERSAGIE